MSSRLYKLLFLPRCPKPIQIIRKDYTVCIVNSAENDGVQGSCPTFKERVNVSQDVRGHDGSKVMTLEEIQEK